MELQDILSIVQLGISERDARIAELEKQIADMQQPGSLTAQELYRISGEAYFTSHPTPWEKIPRREQGYYKQVVNFINGVYINPLQGLVRDYQEFTIYDQPVLKSGRDEWQTQRDKLHERSNKLLGEELHGSNNAPN